jgi:hypothetical protein
MARLHTQSPHANDYALTAVECSQLPLPREDAFTRKRASAPARFENRPSLLGFEFWFLQLSKR